MLIIFIIYMAQQPGFLLSKSCLVKGQEVHPHVQCGRGFSCPSDCLVEFSNLCSIGTGPQHSA